MNLYLYNKKNKVRHKGNRQRVRVDALMLAVILFLEMISPTFIYGRNLLEKISHPTFEISNKSLFTPIVFEEEEEHSKKVDFELESEINFIEMESEIMAENQISLLIPGGPDQPEVQSFTPAGTDDMVDPFSGSFSYNIPIMDIDGYPINLAYSAGIGMEQEATWVGLGWNLNPGVVNRNMRGIPDDFDGKDKIKQEMNQADNWTAGVTVGADYEIFGLDTDVIGLSVSSNFSVQYNNYSGYNSSFSFGPAFSIGEKVGFDVGLQFTGSSQAGASIGANVGLGINKMNKSDVSSKLSIGSSFNSRQGLQEVSINASVSKKVAYENFREKLDEKYKKGSHSVGSGGASFAIGMSSYVAQIPFDTKANSFTARFKIGGDIVGNDISGSFTGFFSKSKLAFKEKFVSAYGYFNLQNGQNNETSMLDFNRENESSFTKNTPALPIPYLMYDVFSVSGQGVSGNYRIDRQDIGYVFDPKKTSSSNSFTAGGEVGLGATFKAGVDVGTASTRGSSGVWKEGNSAVGKFKFKSSRNFFREANELSYDESEDDFQKLGGDNAVYIPLTNEKKLSNKLAWDAENTVSTVPIHNNKSQSFKMNQPLTHLRVYQVRDSFGITMPEPSAFAFNSPSNVVLDDHIGAFTVTKTDGARYYYGLPAYSMKQKNVTFAVGAGKNPGQNPELTTNLVPYTAEQASVNNKMGLDHYYNAQTIPAYAHSYMLTAVLGPDYVDSDSIRGPSIGDLGSYVEFRYKQIPLYKWRNPVVENKASFDKGLNTDITDDKANYIYGEKELWYLDTIKTKNHIAIFSTSPRMDAVSTKGERGGLESPNSNNTMLKLDSIRLYSRPDLEKNGQSAVPIKTAHFKYDYRLSRGYWGNVESNSGDTLKGGKLTLTKVYFTYQDSYKGERTPYVFEYGYNPNYNPNNVDRWGTYKPNPTGLTGNEKSDPLTNAEFPYVGNNKIDTDLWASAWNLKTITLPSGGKIEVDYESGDYAYVQHKKAQQMFKIIGVEGGTGNVCSISDVANLNRKIYFELLPGTEIKDYAKKGDMIYFKALLSMNSFKTRFDYVPGYAEISEIGTENGLGYIKFKPEPLSDKQPSPVNPIAITGIQFARNYLSRIVPPSAQDNPQSQSGQDQFLGLAKSLIGAFASFGELFTGPNYPLWQEPNGIGTHLVLNKSWVRLNTPNNKKLGGGYRVKEIRTYDSWDVMVDNGEGNYYGQHYIYTEDGTSEGKSSGVASYEPQIGGEENVWRTPLANDVKLFLAPDIRNYMETPFGEQFFPSASVGYSKVWIKDIEHEGGYQTASGVVSNEFYTARDFPTRTERTALKTVPRKFNINVILFAKSEDILSASQGFLIENNDMHGKPKLVASYAEGQDVPYSSVEYVYQAKSRTFNKTPAHQLVNEVKVIQPDGTVKKVTVGRTYEAVADFRESTSRMNSGNIGINLNFTLPFILIPMILGANYSQSKTEFRSASFTKTIERKGILHKTIAKDYGATIETENLAYDSETGEVLLSSVNNNYRDTVYNFTYPAHWVYEGMGQAYKNLGAYRNTPASFTNDGYSSSINNSMFFEGDEVMFLQNGEYKRAWVTEASVQGVRMVQKDGTPINGSLGSVEHIKILRSGRRNLQSTPVGSLTLKENPLNTISGNVFSKVLSAGSIVYGNAWKTYCDCNDSIISNPYVIGLKGNWFPKASYSYLSGRTQAFENKNTNIREDGLLTTFHPFYELMDGQWNINQQNWTYTAEVTEFNPSGDAIETVDALDRYSSVQHGYNQTLQVAAAQNAMRKEMGFNGFEDYMFNSCPDEYFRFGTMDDLTDEESHTGRYSIKVNKNKPVIFQKQIAEVCDVDDPCDFTKYFEKGGPRYGIYVMDSEGISMTYDVIYGDVEVGMTEIPGGINVVFYNNSQSLPARIQVTLSNEEGCSSTFIVELLLL